MRHQLEVGREVRPVTQQVRVVELEIDEVLDAAVAVRAEVAALVVPVLAGRASCPCAGRGCRDRERDDEGDRAAHFEACSHVPLLRGVTLSTLGEARRPGGSIWVEKVGIW